MRTLTAKQKKLLSMWQDEAIVKNEDEELRRWDKIEKL